MSSESEDESVEFPLNSSAFTNIYTCGPLLNCSKKDIECGGKLFLPASALIKINSLKIEYPLTFKVLNDINNRFTHAGVLEFTAEEGQVKIPQWMMDHLGLLTGDSVKIETVFLPVGTYCMIEGLTRNIAYASDVKTLFENNFKYFTCLTEGDILFLHDRDRRQRYKVMISEVRPKPAANISECDLEVDYSVPKKIEKRKPMNIDREGKKSSESIFRVFQGKGNRLDGKTVLPHLGEQTSQIVRKSLSPFTGIGHVQQDRKRKADENNDDETAEKKRKVDVDSLGTRPTEQNIFRGQQKLILKCPKKESSESFPGHGYLLKDN